MFWLIDVAGAALFAYGIADGVGALVGARSPEWPALLALILGATIRAGAVLLVHNSAIRSAQQVTVRWRARLFPRLLGGRIARPLLAGESATLAIDHVAAIEAHGARFQPVRMGASLSPLLVAVITAFASWVSALIMLGTMVPFIVGMILAGTAARHASERQLTALGELSGLFVDRVRNLPVIRHFGAEERITRQVTGATREVALRTIAVLRTAFISGAVLEFFSALAVALIAVYCGFSLLGLLPFSPPEHLTLTRAFFALAMAPEFYLPMRRLAAAYHEKQLGEAAMEALDEAVPDLPDTPAEPVSAFDGLTVSGLAIDWPGTRIGPLTFTLGNTDLVALTGPTGSGKTSVLAAIAGQITDFDGSVTTASGGRIAPEAIAWAAQRPLLLPGTLADNIALAAPDASREAIRAVAERVGLGVMLTERSEGLDLMLDHRGSGLSGGERRRLGLARAILSGRPLLLCDEPTADLDADSAADITALLTELGRERCVLVATHDPVLTEAARAEVTL
ncbi:thiol reductant ABC exporter subunit CydD [Stakelama sediminis]|uniref:ATP-binding cassette subfamily C protein CydD n=1 Tax=Stakelama sediminis TaxID=463200 RepID=A0A840YZD1_9SPHN|nr:ATP-binding cassette domain-containing protein [Stakelama sediminis]MBB5719058.1 ATP-binding cassette subfamily C protein CydD [Stakelama sediminis]